VINKVIEAGVVYLETLNGEALKVQVNDSQLKLYQEGQQVSQ
jgi:hypothetical protein